MLMNCTCITCGHAFQWEDIGDHGPTPTTCDECLKKLGEIKGISLASLFVSSSPSSLFTSFPSVADTDDAVRPAYYKGREVMDIINRFKLSFCMGTVLCYVLRHKEKNGVEDLKKAKWYLEEEIRLLESLTESPLKNKGGD